MYKFESQIEEYLKSETSTSETRRSNAEKKEETIDSKLSPIQESVDFPIKEKRMKREREWFLFGLENSDE